MRTTVLVLPLIALFTACDGELLAPYDVLRASAVSPVQINLTWDDNARAEIGWEVHRSTSGDAGPFIHFASLRPDAVSYDNSGLTELTEYCYKVRSVMTSGDNPTYGAFSPVACATTAGPRYADEVMYRQPLNEQSCRRRPYHDASTDTGRTCPR